MIHLRSALKSVETSEPAGGRLVLLHVLPNERSTQTIEWYDGRYGSTCIDPDRHLVERWRDRTAAMQDTYDPFSFLLTEIQAYDAGQRNWTVELRQHYLDTLLADEAEEIAWGRRHLTFVYGPAWDPVSEQILDELIHGIVAHVPPANWCRLGGVAGHHVTVTLDGPDADALIDVMADVARRANPGPWRLVTTAVVVPGR